MELILIPWTLLWAIVCSLIGARKGDFMKKTIIFLFLFFSVSCQHRVSLSSTLERWFFSPNRVIYSEEDIPQNVINKYASRLSAFLGSEDFKRIIAEQNLNSDEEWVQKRLASKLFMERNQINGFVVLRKIEFPRFIDSYRVEIYLALTEDCPLINSWRNPCGEIYSNLPLFFWIYPGEDKDAWIPYAQIIYINKSGNQLCFNGINLTGQYSFNIYCDSPETAINDIFDSDWACRQNYTFKAQKALRKFFSHPFPNYYSAKKTANIRESFSMESPIIIQVDETTSLKLLSVYHNWYKVKYGYKLGQNGWVHKSVVKEEH